MKFFWIECDKPQFVQSENNMTECINFLKFSNTAFAAPFSRELQLYNLLLTIAFATIILVSINRNREMTNLW